MFQGFHIITKAVKGLPRLILKVYFVQRYTVAMVTAHIGKCSCLL